MGTLILIEKEKKVLEDGAVVLTCMTKENGK